MHTQKPQPAVLGIFIFFLSCSAFFVFAEGETRDVSTIEKQASESEETTLLFVGDIMLGRVVESHIEREGFLYPFLGIAELLSSTDFAIGNFEGSVPEVHKKTKPYMFKFSIKKDYLKGLADTGFDILSLANNHADDFGALGLTHTRERCAEYALACIGAPRGVNDYSTLITEANGKTIGYAFLNTVFIDPDEVILADSLKKLRNKVDFLVVYVHWGEEYDLVHSKKQEYLAHSLIDTGVDLVVGHHPHVVQDVEEYKGKLIVYSLGNFVFDQYFSDDVMEGLVLKVTLGTNTTQYEFMGISSKENPSQPWLMDEASEQKLFSRILKNIEHDKGHASMFAFD